MMNPDRQTKLIKRDVRIRGSEKMIFMQDNHSATARSPIRFNIDANIHTIWKDPLKMIIIS